MARQGGTGPKATPQNDLYTALLIIAASLLLFGTIYIAARSSQLFGSIWPEGGA